jgi:putative transposase
VVKELREKYSLHLLLDIAGLKKSTYFYALEHLDYKEDKDKEIGDLIVKIFNDNHKKYGRPRIVLELKRMGIVINNKKVYRIMKDRGLTATPRKRKYSSYKGKIGKICRNHLLKKRLNKNKHIYIYERHFETNRPYQILGTDVTQFQIAAGKLYLSPIIDFHTREILGYDISTSPNYAQIRRMMKMMFDRHGEVFSGLILHSDQGYQYQMKAYQKLLKEHGIIQSMSRKGNCLDNSPTENFFGRLKTEIFYDKEFEYESLDQLKRAIEKYIKYYNEERIVVKYGDSPINIRQSYQNQV